MRSKCFYLYKRAEAVEFEHLAPSLWRDLPMTSCLSVSDYYNGSALASTSTLPHNFFFLATFRLKYHALAIYGVLLFVVSLYFLHLSFSH